MIRSAGFQPALFFTDYFIRITVGIAGTFPHSVVSNHQESLTVAFLRKGFLKAAHWPNELYCHIDPIPYFGLAIVLLCIFMVINPPLQRRYIELVKSPHARSVRAATKEDAMRITVTRDGTIYFRNYHVTVDQLPNRIRDATLNGAEKRIYLVVDARYGDVKLVLPQIQLAGIEKVCFLTD